MAEVRDLILKLKKEDKTLFISSHMLSEIQQTADKVALINRGEILAYDTVDALSQKYFTVKEVSVDTALPASDEQIGVIEKLGIVRSVARENEHRLIIRFEGDCDACRYDLLKALIDAGVQPTSFVPKGLALESIYMEMIK
jgi:ABC-2 type transport system ATP-binding protein